MTKKNLWSRTVENIKDLNFEAKGKTVLVSKLDSSILAKAEVIGVAEIICLEDESKTDSEIKVKKIDKDEWKKLR